MEATVAFDVRLRNPVELITIGQINRIFDRTHLCEGSSLGHCVHSDMMTRTQSRIGRFLLLKIRLMENTKNAVLPEAVNDRWCVVPQASDDLIFSSRLVVAGKLSRSVRAAGWLVGCRSVQRPPFPQWLLRAFFYLYACILLHARVSIHQELND